VFVQLDLSSAPVPVGQTTAVCASNISSIAATCGTASDGQCNFLWRVDKAE
jgi:hypothetical protein